MASTITSNILTRVKTQDYSLHNNQSSLLLQMAWTSSPSASASVSDPDWNSDSSSSSGALRMGTRGIRDNVPFALDVVAWEPTMPNSGIGPRVPFATNGSASNWCATASSACYPQILHTWLWWQSQRRSSFVQKKQYHMYHNFLSSFYTTFSHPCGGIVIKWREHDEVM